jgi:hypothetical protein
MDKAKIYRVRAAQCLTRAIRATKDPSMPQWLDMADRWLSLSGAGRGQPQSGARSAISADTLELREKITALARIARETIEWCIVCDEGL